MSDIIRFQKRGGSFSLITSIQTQMIDVINPIKFISKHKQKGGGFGTIPGSAMVCIPSQAEGAFIILI